VLHWTFSRKRDEKSIKGLLTAINLTTIQTCRRRHEIRQDICSTTVEQNLAIQNYLFFNDLKADPRGDRVGDITHVHAF
jgi:hypothetical protein